jgi:hypothetical protein
MKGVRFLILVLALLAFAFVPTAAAPLSDPCPPGTAYHPACDVDDNGVINIDDIMRTASRWLTSGPAVSDNNHDHLGQTWTGSNNPLRIEGSFSDPNSSPLVVVNSDLLGGGILVDTLGSMGIEVERASYSGVYVHNVGNAPVTNQSVDACGFQVAGVQGHGLWVGRASKDGVSVYRAGTVDTPVDSSEANGFEVAGAQGNGLFVGRALGDGVHIRSTTDDGIQLGEDGVSMPYGLYVPPPGTMYSTLLPDTAAANGEWALYTEDKIRAANVAMDAQTLVAVVGGDQPLAAGDVVTAVGLADVLPGSHERLALVGLAGGETANVVGVVSSRMALQPLPGKGGQEELHGVAGPARPGDYVAIIVLGVAQVKVQDGAAIQPGQRLTPADTPGTARALRTVQVEGVSVDEGGPALGVALEPVKDGMVWVLVNPQ